MPKERAIGRRWAWLSGRNPMARWGYHGPELKQSLRVAVEEFRPDVVQCEQLYLAHFFMALLGDQDRPRLVFNAHDAIHVVLERSRPSRAEVSVSRYLLDSWFVAAVRRMEAKVVRKADLVCCVSSTDADSLRLPTEAQRFAITANGVDIDYFSPTPDLPASHPPLLVFAGSMTYEPNADAIEFYMERMHGGLRTEFPNLKLLVIGSITERLRKYQSVPGVEFVGFQRDIRPYFDAAQLSIVPLRAGSGTRFKILESWAMGRPVVSTTIGAEGLPFQDMRNILIADTPDAFCIKVSELLRDADLRSRLSVAGRALVEAEFSWQGIVSNLDRQLRALCATGANPVA
jgi:glycosyltransferase involved in cell wall biosynthesis